MNAEEAKKNTEEIFEVTEPVEMDLSEVKEERTLLPPAQDVKLGIRKAVSIANEAGTYRQLNISFQLVDGIMVGEELKYKGMIVFERMCYYADTTAYTKDWFKKKQHLVAIQQLMKALGKDMKFTVNDEFLGSLTAQVVMASIGQKPNNFTAKDGTKVSNTINTVSRFKAVPATDGV